MGLIINSGNTMELIMYDTVLMYNFCNINICHSCFCGDGEIGTAWTSGYVGPPLIFVIVAGAFFYPSILKRLLVVSLSTNRFHGDCMRYVSCMLCFLI